MTRTERMHAWLRGDKTVSMCVYCKHFHVHYVYYAIIDQYTETDCGHCCHPRLKSRSKFDVCERFERKE